MSLDEFIDEREIIICCGAGGVGKTTVAASIGAEAARRGKKTLVLTIDPAKRLAAAMGLSELGNEEKRIPDKAFAQAGIEPARREHRRTAHCHLQGDRSTKLSYCTSFQVGQAGVEPARQSSGF